MNTIESFLFSFSRDRESLVLICEVLFVVFLFVIGFKHSKNTVRENVLAKRKIKAPVLFGDNIEKYKKEKRIYKKTMFFLFLKEYFVAFLRILTLIVMIVIGFYFGGIIMTAIGKMIADVFVYLWYLIF